MNTENLRGNSNWPYFTSLKRRLLYQFSKPTCLTFDYIINVDLYNDKLYNDDLIEFQPTLKPLLTDLILDWSVYKMYSEIAGIWYCILKLS